MADVPELLRQICRDQLGLDAEQVRGITDASRFIEDMGMDSLDTVEMVMPVEEEWNLEIPDEEAEKCLTFGQAVAYIKSRIK